MTWEEITAMDPDALNIAIEALEGRVWHQTTLFTGQTAWQWETTYSTVAHLHTSEDWTRCMALAFHYHLDISVPDATIETPIPGVVTAFLPIKGFSRTPFATEAECRLILCRLALLISQKAATP